MPGENAALQRGGAGRTQPLARTLGSRLLGWGRSACNGSALRRLESATESGPRQPARHVSVACYRLVVARKVRIWTWDCGSQPVDMDRPTDVLAPLLEQVLAGCLWEELEKFPPDTVERLLPHVRVAPHIRRLVEIWIEERRRPAA